MEAEFLAATEECDLVMKGGVTSGIVYPPVVRKLAKKYRFRNVGGTSAGAIAAAVTAAAEYGRETGGFTKLKALSDKLGEEIASLNCVSSPKTGVIYVSLLKILHFPNQSCV